MYSVANLSAFDAWRMFVYASAAEKSLGLIPPSAVSAGVQVLSDRVVLLVFQLRHLGDDDLDDMKEIAHDLLDCLDEAVEFDVEVELEYKISSHPVPGSSRPGPVEWFWRRSDRLDDTWL